MAGGEAADGAGAGAIAGGGAAGGGIVDGVAAADGIADGGAGAGTTTRDPSSDPRRSFLSSSRFNNSSMALREEGHWLVGFIG